MKILSVSFIAIIVLLFCFSTSQAQNQSDQNSQVIFIHQTYGFSRYIDCPETGVISFKGEVLEMFKFFFKDGSATRLYNARGEGMDENGGTWTWKDVWIFKYGTHEVRTLILQGPKGAKMKGSILFVTNGNGEIIQLRIDLPCGQN